MRLARRDPIPMLLRGRFFPPDADWIKDTSKPCPVTRGGALLDFRIQEGAVINLKVG